MSATQYRRLSVLITKLMVKGNAALTVEERAEYRTLIDRMERADQRKRRRRAA